MALVRSQAGSKDPWQALECGVLVFTAFLSEFCHARSRAVERRSVASHPHLEQLQGMVPSIEPQNEKEKKVAENTADWLQSVRKRSTAAASVPAASTPVPPTPVPKAQAAPSTPVPMPPASSEPSPKDEEFDIDTPAGIVSLLEHVFKEAELTHCKVSKL